MPSDCAVTGMICRSVPESAAQRVFSIQHPDRTPLSSIGDMARDKKKRHRTNPAELISEAAKSAVALGESDAHAELAGRGSLLQAVGTGLAELLTADSVRVALHGVLERCGTRIGAR